MNDHGLEKLAAAIYDYDDVAAAGAARAVLADGVSPEQALATVSTAMKDVGDQFNTGELFLPELIGAAEAAKAGLAPIEEAIVAAGQQVKTAGTVVLGTVAGDVHSIGKTMVGAFLTASGFRVIDLGTDVPAARFIEAVQEHSPDILAMSALLTSTMVQQLRVIQTLSEAGLRERVKVMVGGGAMSPDFAQEIGADAYGATAPDAARLARDLMGC